MRPVKVVDRLHILQCGWQDDGTGQHIYTHVDQRVGTGDHDGSDQHELLPESTEGTTHCGPIWTRVLLMAATIDEAALFCTKPSPSIVMRLLTAFPPGNGVVVGVTALMAGGIVSMLNMRSSATSSSQFTVESVPARRFISAMYFLAVGNLALAPPACRKRSA